METNNAIMKFNSALRSSVEKEWEELKNLDDSAKIYRFDIENVGKDMVNLAELKKDPPDNCIEYYWIEYKENEKRKKIAFFFKDVDTRSHNVHVVPGLFEEYEYRKEKNPPTDKPYADVENGKAFIKNIKRIYEVAADYYPTFAEQDADGGWWCPVKKCIPVSGEYKNKHVITIDKDSENGIKTIYDFKTVFDSFSNYEISFTNDVANKIYEELIRKSIEKVTLKSPYRTERYTPICWYNFSGTNYSIYLTKPIYFSGYGFFTQYHCIDFGEDKKDIVTNCQVDLKAPFSLSDNPKTDKLKEYFERFMNGEID